MTINEDLPVTKYLPLLKRFLYAWKFRFSRRELLTYEFRFEFPKNILELELFVARIPIYICISIPKSVNLNVKSVSFFDKSEKIAGVYGVKYFTTEEYNQIHISPPNLQFLNKLAIEFEKVEGQFNYWITIYVDDSYYTDQIYYEAAINYLNSRNYDKALESIDGYSKYCDKNPYVLNLMSYIYYKKNNIEKSLEFAVKTIANGHYDDGFNRYQSISGEHNSPDLKQIRNIQKEGTSWGLENHYGIIVLSKKQSYNLGLDGLYVNKHHEILEIRRSAAARMLTSVNFDFSTREHILTTWCRVISPDDKIIELSTEQFVVSDSKDRNIYITMEQDKNGSWILPELSTDDIIEWGYDLLCRENYKIEEDKPHLFIITNPHNPSHPTLKAETTFKAPNNWSLKFDSRNKTVNLNENIIKADNHTITSITLEQYNPIKNINCYYEHNYQNPVIACTASEFSWQSVSKEMLKRNIGELQIQDELPLSFEDIVKSDILAIKKLEKIFYWVRDNIKYASVSSALEHIGKMGRAKAILESGVADCKDKSYLLYQVCQRLNLKAEYVLISTKQGIIFKELPSDQFDHVMIRVFYENELYYLDGQLSV